MALAKAHVTGPHRTLMQDPVFAIDQLVEIAIRALSPAVNDTFKQRASSPASTGYGGPQSCVVANTR